MENVSAGGEEPMVETVTEANAVADPSTSSNAAAVQEIVLYVEDLDGSVTEEQLKELFDRVGEVKSVKISVDEATEESSGFGYVYYRNPEDAAKAMELLNFTSLNGKPIRITCSEGIICRYSLGTIFFKNLDEEIDEKGLKDKFSAYGNVISCSVALDSSGGFGYVQFDNEEDARNATQHLNGVEINGKKLYVITDITKLNFSVVYVYVSNFSEWMTEEDLKSTFGEYGLVNHVYLARDEDGISKCFGHVCFEKWEDAAKSVEGLNDKIFYGKNWHVEIAPSGCENDWLSMRNLYVKNIDDTVGDEDFEKLFSPFGVITSCRFIRNRSGKLKQYGFVEFCFVGEAIEAIKGLNGKLIGSKHLYVGIAERKKKIKEACPSEEIRRNLGERLYPLVEQLVPEKAPKVTGMILDLDQTEVLHLLESPHDLQAMVSEAMDLLQSNGL